MGVLTNTEEFSSPIDPARLFHTLFIDPHNSMPKLMPSVIKSVEILSGEGGPGSILQINFAQGGPFKYAKHRLDEVDRNNLLCKYTVIEGDILGDKLKNISCEVKLEPAESTGGGSICKTTSKHYTKGDAELKPEEATTQKENVKDIDDTISRQDNPSPITRSHMDI